MKKLSFLFASLVMIAALISCNKEMTDDSGMLKKKSGTTTTMNVPSDPISDNGIVPYIIPGSNRGGNRTCAEVATAFNTTFALCGDKLDYGDYDYDGDYEFNGAFFQGLDVTVDGNFISFEMSNCLHVGDKMYKVGAVIVKGSSAANVYFYPEGSMGDSGLAAPGGNRMVSNLTFCFVECEEENPEWVLALKTYLIVPEMSYAYAISAGTGSEANAIYIGYNNYVFGTTNVYPLVFMWDHTQVGTITAKDYWENDIHYLEVVVDTYNDEWMFKETLMYVGTLEGYNAYQTLGSDGLYYTSYGLFPFIAEDITDLRTFKIPFSEITE